MRHLYHDDLSRQQRGQGKIVGRGVAMAVKQRPVVTASRAVSSSVNCWKKRDEGNQSGDGVGHHDSKRKNMKYFAKKGGSKAGPKGAAGQKWCSVHKTATYSDGGCYAQGVPRPKSGDAHFAPAVLTAGSPPVIDDNNEPSLNFEDDFDHGLACSALATGSGGGISDPYPDKFTMLVNSGASDHFVDDELVPGLRQRVKGLNILQKPKSIATVGDKQVFHTATGTICGHIHQPVQPAYSCAHLRMNRTRGWDATASPL